MADDTWTVQDAKAQLSELLRRARTGKPQRIGLTDDACIVISAQAWEILHPSALGPWLVDNAPAGAEFDMPPRGSHRPDPFATDRG